MDKDEEIQGEVDKTGQIKENNNQKNKYKER